MSDSIEDSVEEHYQEAARLQAQVQPPALWRGPQDVLPLVQAAEHLLAAGDVVEAFALLQPKVYIPLADALNSPINRLGWWGEWRAMEAVITALAEQVDKLPQPADRLAVHLVLNTVYERLLHYDRALLHFDTARALARQLGDGSAESFLLNNLGNILSIQGHSTSALQTYRQGLALARQSGDRLVEGTILNNIGEQYTTLGQLQMARTYLEQAWHVARNTTDVASESWYVGNLAQILFHMGDYAANLALTDRVLPRARRFAEPLNLGLLLIFKARSLTELGQFPAATAVYKESIALADKASVVEIAVLGYAGLAEIAVRQSDLDQARTIFTRVEHDVALALAQGTSQPEVHIALPRLQSSIALAAADKSAATSAFQQLASLATEHELPAVEIEALLGLARVQADQAAALDYMLQAFERSRDKEHRVHAQILAALNRLAAEWPGFWPALDVSPTLDSSKKEFVRATLTAKP